MEDSLSSYESGFIDNYQICVYHDRVCESPVGQVGISMTEERKGYFTLEELKEHGKFAILFFIGSFIAGMVFSEFLYSYLPETIWIFEKPSNETFTSYFIILAAFFLGRALVFLETQRVLGERIEMANKCESWE